nr:MAG TPA: hypothetical protein [Caudoviricetes sp.]
MYRVCSYHTIHGEFVGNYQPLSFLLRNYILEKGDFKNE